MKKRVHDRLLFWLGLLGILFYASGPVLFGKDTIREPELLPVYTAMMGIASLKKKEDKDDS